MAVAIFGQTRYRTPLDVVLIILTAVAVDHWMEQRARGRPPRRDRAGVSVADASPEPAGMWPMPDRRRTRT